MIGFIVIPFGDAETPAEEVRRLAADMQAALAARMGLGEAVPFVSHWIDHPTVVEFVARHLVSKGHSAPDCAVCP